MSHTPHTPSRPALLDVALARQQILAALQPVSGSEWVFLRDALGRTLAEDIRSPRNVPAVANSAMDGYALRQEDIDSGRQSGLQLTGSVHAGHSFSGSVGSGECVRIMTGAPVPTGADTVVIQEHARREGDTVYLDTPPRPGANVRLPGEDLATGQTVLPRGRQITAADLGLLASLGIAEVRASRRLRVAFFSTGDELRSLGESLVDGQIYDSNRYTLYGMLSRLGVDIIDMGIIADRRDDVAAAFHQASAMADVLITSGGVSVGDADYVKETLEQIGQVNFWKIAMKPGKPLAFGKLDNTVFFGLPGNPVSSMATFYQLVQPALQILAGQTPPAPLLLQVPLLTRLKKTPGRADYQRGILESDASGRLAVRSTGPQGSHILSSMSQANCFIILPADSGDVEAGSEVTVQPFAGLM